MTLHITTNIDTTYTLLKGFAETKRKEVKMAITQLTQEEAIEIIDGADTDVSVSGSLESLSLWVSLRMGGVVMYNGFETNWKPEEPLLIVYIPLEHWNPNVDFSCIASKVFYLLFQPLFGEEEMPNITPIH